MFIALGIIAIIVIYLVSFFNGLQTLKVQINASIQEIGNQLKRQSQLIPGLIDSVKGYMKHEKGIFEDLTSARKLIDQAATSNDGKTIDKAQSVLNKAMESIRVVVESNPQIQASGVVTNLMEELRDTADKLMYARRTVIDLSADFNVKISTIPGIWIAPMMGFQPQKGLGTPVSGEFLEVSDAETKTPEVKLN
jgi:LemA protein